MDKQKAPTPFNHRVKETPTLKLLPSLSTSQFKALVGKPRQNEVGTVTDILDSTEKTSEVDSDDYLRDSALATVFPSKKQSFANHSDIYRIDVKVSPR